MRRDRVAPEEFRIFRSAVLLVPGSVSFGGGASGAEGNGRQLYFHWTGEARLAGEDEADAQLFRRQDIGEIRDRDDFAGHQPGAAMPTTADFALVRPSQTFGQGRIQQGLSRCDENFEPVR